MRQDDLAKFLKEVQLPLDEYTKYADQAHLFSDTTPKMARPLDAPPQQQQQQQQQPVPYQPQVQIIPASGYPVLSQSFHAAQLEQVRAVPGSGMVVLPSSYTSSLLGNNQMMGQSFNNHSLGYSLSNAQLSYSLGSSSRDPHMERDDQYHFRDMSGGSRGEAFMAA
jgi:hypothetical protein